MSRRLRKLASRLRAAVLSRRAGVALGRGVDMAGGVRVHCSSGGRLALDEGVAVAPHAFLVARGGALEIGARGFVGQGSVIAAQRRVSIGPDCLIAEYVTIRDQNHRVTPGAVTARNGFDVAPIVIGANVWIGAKATVLPGVTIGDNAVVGANAVVTRDVPANSIAVGVPAKLVRTL